MSALTDARDHARKMAEWTDPRDASDVTGLMCLDLRQRWNGVRLSAENEDFLVAKHDQCDVETCSCACHPRKVVPEAERELWTRLADEIDAYLEPDEVAAEDGPGLFGEGS